jgi:hypothetical protein
MDSVKIKEILRKIWKETDIYDSDTRIAIEEAMKAIQELESMKEG